MAEKARITYLGGRPVKTGFCAKFMARFFQPLGSRMQGWDARPKARQIVGRAFKSSWQIVRSMPLLLLAAAVAYALVSVTTSEISNFLPASMADQAAWSSDEPGPLTYVDFLPLQILLLAALFLQTVIASVVEFAIYRFILLGKAFPESLSISTPIVRQLVAWNFSFDLIFHAIAQTEFLSPPWDWFCIVLPLALIIACFSVTLILPAIAVEASSASWQERIRTAFRQTNGNLRLLYCGFGIILCLAIPIWLALYFSIGGWENNRMLASQPYLTGEALLTFIFEVLLAAAISWIYAWVAGAGAQKPNPAH